MNTINKHRPPNVYKRHINNIDFIKRDDKVTVPVYGPDGTILYQTDETNCHSLEAAVQSAIENAPENINPEDCVFSVNKRTKDVTHLYLLNAHAHLKLII